MILGLLDPHRLQGEPAEGFPGTSEKLDQARKYKELEKAAFWLWNNDLEGDKGTQVTAMLELWEEHYGTGIPDDIVDSASGKIDIEGLLAFLLQTSDHWLNQREADFILESWQKRNERIEELKRQRDEARAHLSALQSMELMRRDPTLGLNLAYHVYRSFPSETTSAVLLETTSNDYRFYGSVFRHEERVWFATFFQDSQGGQNKQWVVTKTAEKGLLLWNTGQREPGAGFPPEDGALPPRDSPDGQSLVVGNFDHKLRFYDLEGNLEAILPVIHQETGTWFSNFCYSPDGEQLLAGIGSRVYVWPVRQERIKVSEEKSGNFPGGLADVLFLPSWGQGGKLEQ